MNKTVAIKTFLRNVAPPDLAELYNFNMECQVNVAQDGGERIENTYKGRRWHGWSDGITTWKSFRIPYNANSEPEFTDSKLTFSLDDHAEGIGMTGWDWVDRKSRWVAFDFDAISGHSDSHQKKMSPEQLEELKNKAIEVPWVTIRSSTSGRGLHLYVFLEPVETKNHTEHAGLARAILSQLSALVGFDFTNKVDVCGGNMWVWHRKIGSDGLRLVKQGEKLRKEEIPRNWRDHVEVVTKRSRRNIPQKDIASQLPKTILDDTHRKLINFLKERDYLWWWDADLNMLVTHTVHLEEAYRELKMIGYFKTLSPGTNLDEQNCFLFPLRNGAWVVRRYTKECDEAASWDVDAQGWTRCYLNRAIDLKTAARAYGGMEQVNGSFFFYKGSDAISAAMLLGVKIDIPQELEHKETTLKQHKDGRLICELDKGNNDPRVPLPGWLVRDKKPYTKIFNAKLSEEKDNDVPDYDDFLRTLVSADQNVGWVLSTDGRWREEPIGHVKEVLKSNGHNTKEISSILGAQILRPWTLVNLPFEPEYPGERQWNRYGAKLRFTPSNKENRSFPTWQKILDHCGNGLDMAVRQDGWCQRNGIIKGGDYLKCWIANLFQNPLQPAPYLFFYGNQNTGKSIFHEALSLLVDRGYQRADLALTNKSGFNGELAGAVICVVEEVDLGSNKTAYDRIKDWVTAPILNIRRLYQDPCPVPNSTHWIQCANDVRYCPPFNDDSRITMIRVGTVKEAIPKPKILEALEKEASEFLGEIMGIELPESEDRLSLPIVTTPEKAQLDVMNTDLLKLFIDTETKECNGGLIKFSEFYDRFMEYVGSAEQGNWSKHKVGRELNLHVTKARSRQDNAQLYIGNRVWKNDNSVFDFTWYIKGEFLEPFKGESK